MDLSKRSTYVIAAVAFILVLVTLYFLFIFQKNPKQPQAQEGSGEVKELGQLDLKMRPYVTLTPTSDGAEIIISIENMGTFDRIEYELTYLADNPQVSGEKIQRGATGTDVNTKDPKYKKSILLGTASRGVRSPDKGITDGKLSMHLFRGGTQYDSETNWDLVKVGARSAEIANRQGNLKFTVGPFSKEYWVIIAETVGVPTSPSFALSDVILPVYGVFSIAPEFSQKASLSITISQETTSPKLYAYSANDNKWQKLDSQYDSASKTLTARTQSFATFVAVK